MFQVHSRYTLLGNSNVEFHGPCAAGLRREAHQASCQSERVGVSLFFVDFMFSGRRVIFNSVFSWYLCAFTVSLECAKEFLLVSFAFQFLFRFEQLGRAACVSLFQRGVSSMLASGARINGSTYELLFWLSVLQVPACLSISRNTPNMPEWADSTSRSMTERRPARFFKEAAGAESSGDEFCNPGRRSLHRHRWLSRTLLPARVGVRGRGIHRSASLSWEIIFAHCPHLSQPRLRGNLLCRADCECVTSANKPAQEIAPRRAGRCQRRNQ